MPRLIVPPHPTHDYACKKCVHFHAELAKDMVFVSPTQAIPLTDAISQGISTTDKILSRIAPCIRFPVWANNDENMYCDEFEERRKF